MSSKIEWTEQTWNPLAGCTVTSAGCTNCYAMRAAASAHLRNHPKYAGLTKEVNGKPVWTGKIGVAADRVWEEPLRWRKPRRVFVNSMGDLFHPNVEDHLIDRAFAIMALSRDHTFQILTKHADRMLAYFSSGRSSRVGLKAFDIVIDQHHVNHNSKIGERVILRGDILHLKDWPLPNVHLGVSVENQQQAELRIPALLATPAALRFISAEPLLGPVDLQALDLDPFYKSLRNNPAPRLKFSIDIKIDALGPQRPWEHLAGVDHGKLDWVIVGGESGPFSRPCDLAHVARIVGQCVRSDVPVFLKQLGAWPVENGARVVLKDRKGGDMAEWPDGLRLRQMPEDSL